MTKVQTSYTVELPEELATLLQEEAAKYQAMEELHAKRNGLQPIEWTPEELIVAVLASRITDWGNS